ncbi:response regulator transcription factor [Vagococcus elongatus]|uniref:DNA-binding response regulator n=1 Tax=Vagococcus elongatus TaxID=180344 RepID=A0A430AHY5_9ENTE|nr:response regulator [Vagococcus elongatus]RSU07648.1 hypothetical protein CBF29_13215 [Vagococcus elongatus]
MKLLIVDDEKLICEWLNYSIQAMKSFEIIGTANNGSEALSLFYKTRPDIIITDLKMPVMDGLELIKKIRQDNDWVQIIILSAYSEFNLAREALRIGADEYILKTEMNNEVLQEALIKAQNSLTRSKKEQNYSVEKSLSQVHNRKILLNNNILNKDEIDSLKSKVPEWSNHHYFIIAIWTNHLIKGFHLSNSYPINHVFGFHYNDLIYIYIEKISENLQHKEREKLMIDYANEIAQINGCPIAMSETDSHIKNIPLNIPNVINNLELSFYIEENRVFNKMTTEKENDGKNEKEENIFEIPNINLYTKLKVLLSYYYNSQVLPLKKVRNRLWELMDTIEVSYSKNPELLKAIMSAKKIIAKSTKFSELEISINKVANHIKDGDLKLTSKKNSYVTESMKFIEENFMHPISLEDTASYVGLSQEYFSKIFSDENGINYSTYLTKVRLNKARKLLEYSNYKVQNIAESVGYPNVSYFSTVFKKEFGCTPFEYRRKQLRKEI